MFNLEILNKQVLEDLERARGVMQPLTPINAILQKIQEIKQKEQKKVKW